MSFSAYTWRRRSRLTCALTAGLILAGLGAPGFAQESGDSVASRLGRLEQKVKDLQVTLGTLQSFSAKPGAVLTQEAPPQAGDESLGARMDALETQITALTRHVEQIGKQMSAIEEKISALQVSPAPSLPAPTQEEAPPLRQGEAPIPAPTEDVVPLPTRRGETLPLPDLPTASISAPPEEQNYDPSKPRWFGPKPGSDQFATLLEQQGAQDRGSSGEPQSITAALPDGDARELYQQGYGALLQKDYASAEGAFRQLLETYPNNPLASDAQYWIGETYYMRGQYKNAADAFLAGYKKYKSGQKAPDALLKLGMSLAELGQKDAACSTFDELKSKFPQAPKDVSDEAKAWRKKTDC